MSSRTDARGADVRRILIVDDDVDFADSLADLLQPQGYDVRVADRPEAEIGRAHV